MNIVKSLLILTLVFATLSIITPMTAHAKRTKAYEGRSNASSKDASNADLDTARVSSTAPPLATVLQSTPVELDLKRKRNVGIALTVSSIFVLGTGTGLLVYGIYLPANASGVYVGDLPDHEYPELEEARKNGKIFRGIGIGALSVGTAMLIIGIIMQRKVGRSRQSQAKLTPPSIIIYFYIQPGTRHNETSPHQRKVEVIFSASKQVTSDSCLYDGEWTLNAYRA